MSAFRKSAYAVVILLAWSSTAQAQIAALAGSWAQGNVKGDIAPGFAYTELTCNDTWSATQTGKPSLPARGLIRLIKAGDTWLIAENNGFVGYDQVATKPMKVTQGPGNTATLEINGTVQAAAWTKTVRNDVVLTLTPTGGRARIYVQCPILPGKTVDSPWVPPPTTYRAYLECQTISRTLKDAYKTSNPDVSTRYGSYEPTWRTAIGKLKNAGDLGAASVEMDVAFKAMTPPQFQAEVARLIDRCAGAAPHEPYGLLKSASAMPAAPPTRR